jgi:Ca-activated chloride channel family protein
VTRSIANSAILLIVLACVARLAAQEPSFRSSSLGVRVDVLVTDGAKPVAGLTAQDFELRDNGVTQSIALVDAADVPLNVVLALDTSGSTSGARQADLIVAGNGLLDGLKPADRAALTTFSHAVAPRIALTADLGSIRAALGGIKPAGRTSLSDGIYAALAATLKQPGRSLVVVCSDGSDISSWLRPEDLIESAKRANAVVYAVAAADTKRIAALEAVTDATGGDLLRVTSSADIRSAFQKILQDFRNRYVLAYSPTGVPPGGFHRLEVRVKRRGLTVKARPGYTGVEPGR